MPSQFHSSYLSYTATGFSKIVSDYVSASNDLKDFYVHDVNIEGIKNAIEQRKKCNTNRTLLVEQLLLQYKDAEDSEAVKANVHSLLQENTFTICTAHQPNIFTGHLYFIYKILHAIKLADELKKQLPQCDFVPVFFMGSEDADLEELNHVVIDNTKYVWNTKQTGAVGRMKVDTALLQLIDDIAGRLLAEQHGKTMVDALKKCYTKDTTIEQATFLFVHYLFKNYGLVIFMPDNASLKSLMQPVFQEDIFENTPSKIVQFTSEKLSATYKVQAHPREINLFYLKDDIRKRIVYQKDHFIVNDTNIDFTKDELQQELLNYPERFSPNVILRGLYQEIILPNIAFIGGGGELAYWLELKELFQHYHVPYPMLILRNSFLVIEKKITALLDKLHLSNEDLFKKERLVFDEIVQKQTALQLNIQEEKLSMEQLYNAVGNIAGKVDITLQQHVKALQEKALKRLVLLEKKILRAEKRKFSDTKNQLTKIFESLFPEDNLQERTENFMLLYSKWGHQFFDMLYKNSLGLDQEFCVIKEV